MPSQASPSTDLTPDAQEADRRAPDGDDPVGVVFGDVDADRFTFAVREPGLGRGDWVAAEHPEVGRVLARVEGVRRETNLSAQEARTLDAEEAGDAVDDVTAEAQVVGSARGAGDPPRTPVPAGAAVRRAPGSLLATALGLPDPDGPRPRGAYLGKVRGRDVDVVLDVEDLVRRHVSVLAKTGAGKSYLVGVLIEELAKEGVPAVVVDPHGEHDGLARPNRDEDAFPRMRSFGIEPKQYADALRRYHPDPATDPEADPLRLDAANLPRDELEQLVGDLTNAQEGLLHEALRTLRDRPAHYTLEDVVSEVRDSESSAKWSLLSSLESLADRPVFEGEPTDPADLVQRGQVSLVNLRGVDPETAEISVARLANTLFEARKQGDIPPFLLVVEEAHRFAPERGFGSSAARPTLRAVASEGRKFGMGCAIVSQRPAKVDKNVLSQCNTEIAMKVTNPRDVKALASSLEGLTDGMADEIQRLPVGQAVVSHPDLRTPAITEIRPRETRPGGDETPVVADDPAEVAGDAPAPRPDAFPEEDEPEPADGGEEPVEEPETEASPDAEPEADPRPEPDGDPGLETEPEPADAGSEADPATEDEGSTPEAPEGPAPDEQPPETVLDEAVDEPDPATDDDPAAGSEDPEPAAADPPTGDDPEPEPPSDEPDSRPDEDHDTTTQEEAPMRTTQTEPDASAPSEAAVDAVLKVDPDETDADRTSSTQEEQIPAHDALPDDPDDALERAAEADPAPGAGDLEAPASEAAGEPARTVAAVEEAEIILADPDPRDLATERLRVLVDEVEDLLARLGQVGSRTPEVVEAHNGLATQLVRYRRVLADREANEPTTGLLQR
jgi:DNA helicase HerA-like ATPase